VNVGGISNDIKRALAALLLAATCNGTTLAQSGEAFVAAPGMLTPASYRRTGEDPAHLDLWPDQTYHWRSETISQAGRWHADPNGSVIVLDRGSETLQLEVRNSERLRPAGGPDDGSIDLVTRGALEPTRLTLPVTGMFTYYADAPTLVHCATGRRYPVALEGDYLKLEQAYINDRPAPAAPLFATLEATLELREPMEGPARLTVIVDRFDAVWPGSDCAPATGPLQLEDPVWRILSLAGQRLEWAAGEPEPFLAFNRSNQNFSAGVGCNLIGGGYNLTPPGEVAFPAVRSTLKACPDVLAAREAALLQVLEAARVYQVAGTAARLLDKDGLRLAELQAVYLPAR